MESNNLLLKQETFVSTEDTSNDKVLEVTYFEAKSYFVYQEYTSLSIKTEEFSKHSILDRVKFFFTSNLFLDSYLEPERIAVFGMAKTAFNKDNTIHLRMLQTISVKMCGAVLELKDNRWRDLGFQTSDPTVDFRGTGIFSLLQILYLLETNDNFSQKCFKYSRKEKTYFPYCIFLINLTKICLDNLREGFLIKYCNEKRNVIGCLCEFFVGLAKHFFEQYKDGDHTIETIGKLLEEVAEFAKKNRKEVFRYAKIEV